MKKIENLDSTLLDPHAVQEDISLASIEENDPDATYYNEDAFPNIETSLNPPTMRNEETSIFTEGNSPYALSDEVNERAKRIEETINSFDFKILMDFYQVDFSNTVPDADESDESLGRSYNLTDLAQSSIKLQMNSKEFSNAYVMEYPESSDYLKFSY